MLPRKKLNASNAEVASLTNQLGSDRLPLTEIIAGYQQYILNIAIFIFQTKELKKIPWTTVSQDVQT